MDPIGRNGALIRTLLDAAVERHKVISKNLSNIEVPGYRAKELRFSRELEQAIRRGEAPRPGEGAFEKVDRDTPVKQNGNSVDLDRELSEMSENALTYQTLVTLVALKTNLMRTAITGRSG